jgi:pyruvate dehydrogenase (quinone)
MAKKTVGELLVETLIAAGVNASFSLAGDSLNGITEDGTVNRQRAIALR